MEITSYSTIQRATIIIQNFDKIQHLHLEFLYVDKLSERQRKNGYKKHIKRADFGCRCIRKGNRRGFNGAKAFVRIRQTREDVLHSAICEIEGDRAGHILLDAHIDRIGLIVTSVTDEGFLHVAACGGVDRRTLNGQEVTVYGSEPVFGVIASTPPHLASGDNERKATEIR